MDASISKGLFEKLKEKFQLKFDLKPEQLSIIRDILNKKCAMGILPTGFGKSITYVAPPLMLDLVSCLGVEY
jgi:superfamily II DNA helicase RecQ